MEEPDAKKRKSGSIKEQVFRGWKKIPLPVRAFLALSACVGIVLLFAGLLRRPESAAGGAAGPDVSGTGAFEAESAAEGEGSETSVSGQPEITGGDKKEGSGKTDASGGSKAEGSGKPDDEKTEESGKSGGAKTEASSERKLRKLVALTYDDGPSNATPLILDTLEKYGVKATFFVVGRDQVEYHKEALIRAYNDGMEIGSHTYDHRILSKSTQEQIWETMWKNDELLKEVIGFQPKIMRPTGGGINDTVRASIDRPMILWNIDTLDWKYEDKDTIVNTVKAEVHPGAIILMHDLIETTGDSTWQATAEIVPWLLEQGYEPVTVSEMAKAYGYTLQPGGTYYSFNPLWSPDAELAARYYQAFGPKEP